jgi:hypothetical protein
LGFSNQASQVNFSFNSTHSLRTYAKEDALFFQSIMEAMGCSGTPPRAISAAFEIACFHMQSVPSKDMISGSVRPFYFGANFKDRESFHAEASAMIEPLIHSNDPKDRRRAVQMLSLAVCK